MWRRRGGLGKQVRAHGQSGSISVFGVKQMFAKNIGGAQRDASGLNFEKRTKTQGGDQRGRGRAFYRRKGLKKR